MRLCRVIEQPPEDIGKRGVARFGKPPVKGDGEFVGKLIGEVDAIEGRAKPSLLAVGEQVGNQPRDGPFFGVVHFGILFSVGIHRSIIT